MNLCGKILFVSCFLFSIFNISYAQENRWQLVKQIYFNHSTPLYDLYVDVNDVKINYSVDKKIESADVWAKYVTTEAFSKTNSYTTIERYHLDFINATADLVSKVSYKDGEVDNKDPFTAIYGQSPNKYNWSAYIYYYILGKLAHNDEFNQYLNGEHLCVKNRDDDGSDISLTINYNTVSERDGRIYFEEELTKDKGYGFVTHLINKDYIDLNDSKVYTTKITYIDSLNQATVQGRNESVFIYPDTVMERIKNDLIAYCKNNYDWVHRYDNGIK